MAQEFKIGRLRYTWKGAWITATFYNRDAVASYNGKTYVCIEPHTSTDFYANYYNVESSGEVKPYWVIMTEGTSWKGDWTPNTLYTLGEIVLYGGTIYECTTNHTSGLTTITLANWTIYYQVNSTWIGNFTNPRFYKIGDVVKYGGIVYRCTVEHTSTSTYPTYTNWEILDIGIEYKGTWTANISYKINDLVKYGPDIWISRQNHTAVLPFDGTIDPVNLSAIWQLWMPGTDFSLGSTWNALTTYQPGTVVLYGGYSYINLVVNNLNYVPSTSTSQWQLLTTGYSFNDEWTVLTSYKIGTVVRRGGNLFEATQDNIGQDPTGLATITTYTAAGSSGTTLIVANTTGIYPGMIISGLGFDKAQFVTTVVDGTTLIISQEPYSSIVNGSSLKFAGVSGNYWVALIPGTRWRNRWIAGTSYIVGDIAVWVNKTYKCIATHNSLVGNRPDGDTVHAYWTIQFNHDYYNVLNLPGDLIVSAGGQNSALEIGAEGYLLKSVNGVPTWSNVFQSPALYYVAPTGIDAPSSGYTWDNPFKTIKYACERIGSGVLNPEVKSLLYSNRRFITAEAYEWQRYQIINNIGPFSNSTVLTAADTKRDIGYVIDAIAYDIARGGNSQTVAFAFSFFDKEYGNKFITPKVASEINYSIATINQVYSIVSNILSNTPLPVSWQALNNLEFRVSQTFGNPILNLSTILTTINGFQSIITTALGAGNVSSIPTENQGLTSTIMIKTGAYHERLPIVVPANTALNGDELRSVIVYPYNIINTLATRTFVDGTIRVATTTGMSNNTKVQFVSIYPVNEIASTVFGGLTAGVNYYVIGTSITPTTFSVSINPGVVGRTSDVTLTNFTSQMKVFGGDALQDMFRVQNGTGIRNMTLSGLLGTLTAPNTFTTRRPTGGAFVCLDPGTGQDDTSVWIYRKSPYIQNVTTFGTGCVGNKIDGTLHNGGNKSIVSNDFTQIVSDGIGIWCTGPGALTELVSVFSYYAYAGYFAEDGGRVRATNGNSSYGNYGVIAEGYDTTETPITGTVFNRYYEATATPLSALGATANILKLQYSHAGQAYTNPVTNLLKYSNNFTNWTPDVAGNVTLIQSILNPYINQSDAWIATGNTSGTDSSYLYQNVTIAPSGASYTAVAGVNITGGGTSATFDVIVSSTNYIVSINSGGTGYVATNQIRILGAQLGGITGTNDLVITVTELAGSTISVITSAGTVPAGSIQPYTFSIFCKYGTATIFDLTATFSGYSTATSKISFNFITGIITPSAVLNGMIPATYSATPISSNDGWYRLSFQFYDVSGLNNTLQIKLYPRSQLGNTAYTVVYGAQLEIGTRIGFYLNTNINQFTAYANYDVVGAGSGVELIGDEIRTSSIYQTRLLESNGITGGIGYKLITNNAQSGTSSTITIAAPDIGGEKTYLGMRIFVNSGIGAGQYGYVSYYDSELKIATILKESFSQLNITDATTSTNVLTLGLIEDVNSLYVNQPIQFVPTTYDTAVTLVGQSGVNVISTVGGQTNTMIVTSTAQLTLDMEVTFSGTTYGGVTSNFPYYVISIIDDFTLQISLTIGGTPVFLNNSLGTMTLNYPSNNSYIGGSTSNMDINLPIYFTGAVLSTLVAGTDYYINDVLDANNFTISESLVNPIASSSTIITNAITLDSSDALVPLNPIKFTGTSFGNIQAGTKYYINHIINSTSITIASAVATTVATSTQDQGDLITVGDTTGFVIGNPIVISGTTFGGIVNDRVYYVLYVNNLTTLQISATSTALSITVTEAQTSVVINTVTYSNVFTTSGSTGSLAPLNPITFSGTTFGNIISGTPYYVNRIYDATRFSVSGGIISGTATETSPTSNLIHVADTTGFTPGNPIIFGGVAFGNIVSGTTYYISAVNSSTDFTISISPNGNTFELQLGLGTISFRTTTANFTVQAQSGSMIGTSRASASPVGLTVGTGKCIVRTTGNMLSLTTASGTLNATSSTVKKILTSDSGSMTGTFSVPLLGGVQLGTTYYVRTITKGATNTFTITSTSNGSSDFVLSTDVGSMKLGHVGWDHVNPGTTLVPSFDSTTVYSIEPRIVYSKPPFNATTTTVINQAPGTTYVSIAYGAGSFVGLPNNGSTLAVSTTGLSWSPQALPSSATWSSIAYGDNYWVIISSGGAGSGSKVLYSNSNLTTWKPATLPSISTWSNVVYGNGKFVAITNNSSSCAYSLNRGTTWTSASGLTSATWSSLTYGNGKFVAIASGGTTSAYSLDGITWIVNISALPRSTTWSGVAYGNGRFTAISSTSGTAAYSLDGIVWLPSLYNVAGTHIAYGNGVFVAVGDETTGPLNYISEDGLVWDTKNSSPNMGAIAAGISSAGTFRFLTVKNTSDSALITAGSKTKSRALVTAGKITSINAWDPGGNYVVDLPTTTIVDTNATTLATISPLRGNGVLANPTFYNKGAGYNTNTTTITINGDGYAEKFQTGLTLIATGLSRLPVAGDNFAISGDDTIYKVTDATVLDGTTTPNILAEIDVSPEITVGKSPAHGTAVSVRTKYSQVRLTGHDFLNIGYGNFEQSNYPLFPTITVLSQENEAVDANYGRVFYSSTDQDGNFRVGKLFAVEQATGIITLSASQFGLSGLNELKIGGVAVGSNSVIITQFSTDSTFVANSNSIVPTQKAIKSYLGAKLTQGGSNTFTGQLIAGTVLVGGPDRIGSTVLEGNDGWHVKMKSKVNVNGVNDGNGGAAGAWDGDGMAMAFFMKSLIVPKDEF